MSTEEKAEVDIDFRGGDNFPIYPLMQSIIIIFYWMLIKYIVYITFGFKFKTILVKWIFEFVFRTLFIRRQSETTVNRTRINSAQSIFLEYVAKFHHV